MTIPEPLLEPWNLEISYSFKSINILLFQIHKEAIGSEKILFTFPYYKPQLFDYFQMANASSIISPIANAKTRNNFCLLCDLLRKSNSLFFIGTITHDQPLVCRNYPTPAIISPPPITTTHDQFYRHHPRPHTSHNFTTTIGRSFSWWQK